MTTPLINESAYLPFSVGQLPIGDWLVLAPHPDDETFGMGGTLLLAQESGVAVDIIFLTNGQAADPANKHLPKQREEEAKKACKELGIRDIYFWCEADRQLPPSEHLINQLSDVITQYSYASVFFPSPQEPHPDHRMTAVLAWESLRRLKFNASPISYEISKQTDTNLLIDITQVIDRKKETMACYDSQLTNNHYIECIIALNQSRTWSLPLSVSHAEAFYLWPKENRPLNALQVDISHQYSSWQALPKSLPLVSVITRTQNRPDFLRSAIRCLAEQTYPNIELIVINDGGKHCLNLVTEEAIGSIKHFNYQHLETQGGRTQAANIGLKCCQGTYLCFLDDDDLFLPEHLQGLVSFALSHGKEVVYSSTKVIAIDQAGNANDITEYNVDFSAEHLLFENFLPIHSVLFHKNLLNNKTQFDTAFDFFEDWDFWLQLSQKTTFSHLSETTAIYRLHDDSSGIHNHTHTIDPYQQIYMKWLSGCSMEYIFSLIKSSHQWHHQSIAQVQKRNTETLEELGGMHQYALQIVQERDEQLKTLNDQHHYALSIIQERDQQIQELGKQHQYALSIIQERDQQLESRVTRKILRGIKQLFR